MYEQRNQYDVTPEALGSIKRKIAHLERKVPTKTAFLGFDGNIDFLYMLLKSREDLTKWQKMDSMKTLAELILKVAGSSTNVELILKRKVSGGFCANVSKAMGGVGLKVNIIGAMGFPKIDDVFNNIQKNSQITIKSIGNPGITIGLEFDDGKIMLTDFQNLLKINWDLIIERVGPQDIVDLTSNSNIIGIGYWAPIPRFEMIWDQYIQDIFPSLNNLKEKLFLVDLADIKKKNQKDILRMIKILKKVDEFTPVVLSLNDQETNDLAKALNIQNKAKVNRENDDDLNEVGKYLNDELNLSYLIIHSPDFATISTENDHFWVKEGFTASPRYTTSAGDHFNAGMVIGLSCNLTPSEALIIGNALTAIFVRTGNSPNFQQLSYFIENYMNYIEKDIPDFPLNK